MPKPSNIRVIAVGVIRRGNCILVMEGFDTIKGTHYCRPLGGGVHRGETSREALIREIDEEIGQTLVDVRLLDVRENLFELDGKPCHEIVFVHEAGFADPAAYEQSTSCPRTRTM